MEKIKFMNMKEGIVYERESDGKLFKKIGERLLSADPEGTFKETEDVSLADLFSKTHKNANDSLMDIYNLMVSGNISEQKNAHNRLLREIILFRNVS